MPLQGAVPCCPFPRALPWARRCCPFEAFVCPLVLTRLPRRPAALHAPSAPYTSRRLLTRSHRLPYPRRMSLYTRRTSLYPRRMSPYTSRRLLPRGPAALHALRALHEPKAPSPPPRGLTRASRLTRAEGSLHAARGGLTPWSSP